MLGKSLSRKGMPAVGKRACRNEGRSTGGVSAVVWLASAGGRTTTWAVWESLTFCRSSGSKTGRGRTTWCLRVARRSCLKQVCETETGGVLYRISSRSSSGIPITATSFTRRRLAEGFFNFAAADILSGRSDGLTQFGRTQWSLNRPTTMRPCSGKGRLTDRGSYRK